MRENESDLYASLTKVHTIAVIYAKCVYSLSRNANAESNFV